MRPTALALAALLTLASPVQSDDPVDPRAVLERAIAVAGGDTWLNPRTLVLEGTAEFYAPDKPEPVSRADDYRMWRAMDPDRAKAHGADGKVRIAARDGARTIFEVGYDGATTWNDKGVVPRLEADAYWAANLGFGIIRQALKDGFKLENAPRRSVDGRTLDMIRVLDPAGQATLFGIDRESRFIRYMGFSTPRGWHERTYDDFVMLDNPRWLQAREVTLFYNGVRANTVRWKVAKVNEPLSDGVFAVPTRFAEGQTP